MYRPLPLDSIALNQPVPVNIWDPKGVLLLRKGETITSEQHRSTLMLHGPLVLASDWQSASYGYTTALDRMVRSNVSLSRIAQVNVMGVSAEAPSAREDQPVTEAWADLHASLSTLLLQGPNAHHFLERLHKVQASGELLWQEQPDNSLLVLVQMLFDPAVTYSATHALLSACLCALVAPLAGLDDTQRRAVILAALTMNVGMTREHDEMARQAGPLTTPQRKTVREHPQRGVTLLREAGASDAEWLRLVAQHHERPDGTGYPTGQRIDRITHRLLQMADVYVACISPRKSRGAQLSQQVARELYMGAQRGLDPLGAHFVKCVGFYPPGSFVRLVNDEMGVVMRRGEKANTPKVFALVGRHGMPLGEPVLRDTADAAFAVKESLPPGVVKVLVNPARLIARC
ncbi:HD-GYP domain-containing protein [Hydrogenophaga crocea]|uniref:HD domain-containing protein n=1 Tax=Hydrogenophaga crocea TaxID=2716225 RepID=A0A6G8IFG0_9BURK|nr:HD domain-containing phosphohydrolase [Hydrogenophaga crocea]QIM51849.1 HD domain-containing protein [Hydrogenophaga crocea]